MKIETSHKTSLLTPNEGHSKNKDLENIDF